jgi:hypothetical protein
VLFFFAREKEVSFENRQLVAEKELRKKEQVPARAGADSRSPRGLGGGHAIRGLPAMSVPLSVISKKVKPEGLLVLVVGPLCLRPFPTNEPSPGGAAR